MNLVVPKNSIAIWLTQIGLTVLFVLVSVNAQSQELKDLHFESYDTKNGLSSDWLADVALDSTGFVWIGTYDGLNRYDGKEFKIFKHNNNDSTSLLHDNGQEILVNYNGDIWISYAEGGFSLFDKDKQCFINYNSPKIQVKDGLDRYFSIKYIDKKGCLWFSGDGMGLNKYNPQNDHLEHYDLPYIKEKFSKNEIHETNTVSHIYSSPDGLLWLCTENGLYSFNPETAEFKFKIYKTKNESLNLKHDFNKIIPEGQKGLWLSSWNEGMYYFDFESELFTHYDFETKLFGHYNLIKDIAVKNKNELWIVSCDKGLGTFNKLTGKLFFEEETLINGKSKFVFLTRILVTPNQEIFLVDEQALLKYNPFSRMFNFQFLPISKSQHGNLFSITKILENNANNEVYFATFLGNGLNILNTKTNKLTALSVDVNPLKDERIRLLDMIVDKEEKIWLITTDYLYEFDYKNHQLLKIQSPFKYENPKNQMVFKSFIQERNGRILVLTADGGIYPFSIQERKLLNRINQPIDGQKTIEKIDRATFDANGNLWVFGNNELAYFEPSLKQINWINDSQIVQLAKNEVKGLEGDTIGNIWVAFKNLGLLKIKFESQNKFKTTLFTKQNGLPSLRIIKFCIDQDGNIWMSTIMGVVYMNTIRNTFKVFDQAVGMDKFTLGMRFFKSNNNAFYITTPGKYCKVNYNNLNRAIPQPKIYINKFKIFNAEISLPYTYQSKIVIKPNEDFFSFDFGCIDFANPAHNTFAYMLEGWDKDWVYCGFRRYVSYTNLEAGNYTFKVKVANMEGVWGEPIVMPILIESHFYNKSWFTVIIILLIAGLIYGLYLYRINQIEKTEKLKTEFHKQLTETRMAALRAQMNPHFIFNCLNSINRYIIKSDIKTSSMYLTRFAKLIRLILDNSEHKKVVLSNEIEALRLYIEMEALRFDHKFTYEVNVDPGVENDNIEIPPLIIQPYVENAIWHGLLQKDSEGHLLVKIEQQSEVLLIEITDNGIGRTKAQEFKSKNTLTRKSLGMKLTEDRLSYASENIFEGNSPKIIDLYDKNGEACGTTVRITIPV